MLPLNLLWCKQFCAFHLNNAMQTGLKPHFRWTKLVRFCPKSRAFVWWAQNIPRKLSNPSRQAPANGNENSEMILCGVDRAKNGWRTRAAKFSARGKARDAIPWPWPSLRIQRVAGAAKWYRSNSAQFLVKKFCQHWRVMLPESACYVWRIPSQAMLQGQLACLLQGRDVGIEEPFSWRYLLIWFPCPGPPP